MPFANDESLLLLKKSICVPKIFFLIFYCAYLVTPYFNLFIFPHIYCLFYESTETRIVGSSLSMNILKDTIRGLQLLFFS